MKNFGLILVLIGGTLLFFALNMDTTVTTEAQSIGGVEIPSVRVNNLGKMDERRNYILLSSLTIMVAVILYVFGKKNESDSAPSKLPQPAGESIQNENTRKCPFCAEMIKAEAIKCKHCGSDLTQTASSTAPKIALTSTIISKELLQKAYAQYDKMDIDGALNLFKTLILDHPNSAEAEEAKNKITRIFSGKELLTKACDLHYKANDLGLYKLVIVVFPNSPQADYAMQQIGKS